MCVGFFCCHSFRTYLFIITFLFFILSTSLLSYLSYASCWRHCPRRCRCRRFQSLDHCYHRAILRDIVISGLMSRTREGILPDQERLTLVGKQPEETLTMSSPRIIIIVICCRRRDEHHYRQDNKAFLEELVTDDHHHTTSVIIIVTMSVKVDCPDKDRKTHAPTGSNLVCGQILYHELSTDGRNHINVVIIVIVISITIRTGTASRPTYKDGHRLTRRRSLF